MSKLKAEYRALASPKQLHKFLDGKGVLTNREQVAEHFEYDWHARKLTFERHIRGHLLMQATAYDSTRDRQWAGAHDALFLANGAGVEISVCGLAQSEATLRAACGVSGGCDASRRQSAYSKVAGLG